MKFTLLSVPISQIQGSNAARSQRSKEHKQRLFASVLQNGVQQPGIAYKKSGIYFLIAGFGRLEAAIGALHTEFPVQVYEGSIHPLDLLIIACQENNIREGMSFLDQADALDKITKGKRITDRKAGEMIGLKQPVVSKILSAKTRLAEDVALMLTEAKLGYSFAYPLSKVPHDQQREVAKRLIDEKWSRAQLEKELKPEGKRSIRFEGDVSLLLSVPKTATYEVIMEAIWDVAKQIKKCKQRAIPIHQLSQVMQ